MHQLPHTVRQIRDAKTLNCFFIRCLYNAYTFVGGGGRRFFQWLPVPLFGRRIRRRRRNERQTPAGLERERLVQYGRAARIAAADDLVVDGRGRRGGQQPIEGDAGGQRGSDGRLPIVVGIVGGRLPVKRRYGAGSPDPPLVKWAADAVTVERWGERTGQAVRQSEAAAAATTRALPPPRGDRPFVADDRRLRPVVFAVGQRSFSFAGLRRRRCPRRSTQPDLRQPFGQRRHDAEPFAVSADERDVVHADLIHVPVDQPGRSQVARSTRPTRLERG